MNLKKIFKKKVYENKSNEPIEKVKMYCVRLYFEGGCEIYIENDKPEEHAITMKKIRSSIQNNTLLKLNSIDGNMEIPYPIKIVAINEWTYER